MPEIFWLKINQSRMHKTMSAQTQVQAGVAYNTDLVREFELLSYNYFMFNKVELLSCLQKSHDY